MSETLEHVALPDAASLLAAQDVLDSFLGDESPHAIPQDFSAALAAWCAAGQSVEGIAYDASNTAVHAPHTPQQVDQQAGLLIG